MEKAETRLWHGYTHFVFVAGQTRSLPSTFNIAKHPLDIHSSSLFRLINLSGIEERALTMMSKTSNECDRSGSSTSKGNPFPHVYLTIQSLPPQ